MSIIKLPLFFEGSLGEKTLYTLFDSGASYSCISEEAVKDLEIKSKLRKPFEIATVAEGSFLRIEYHVALVFYYNDIRMSDEFYIIPGISEDVILGVNTFQKFRIKLDFEYDSVIIDPKVAKAILK